MTFQRPKGTRKWLRAGDPIPTGQPQRHLSTHGYVVLTWPDGPYSDIRVYEHRLVAGLEHPEVHHKNGNKADNRPDNLEPISRVVHRRLHHPLRFDIDEASRLYASGWSFVELATQYKLNTSTICRAFKRHGLKARTIKESGLLGWHKRKTGSAIKAAYRAMKTPR